MTPTHFRSCVASLHWTGRGLADIVGVNEHQVRRWAAGADIPQDIADWLERLSRFHRDHPPPDRQRGKVAA